MPVRCTATRTRSAAKALVKVRHVVAAMMSAVAAGSPKHRGWLGLLPLPAEVGYIRLRPVNDVTKLGQARVWLGEGWGEGLRSLGKVAPPSPQPSPQRGEGAHRNRWSVGGPFLKSGHLRNLAIRILTPCSINVRCVVGLAADLAVPASMPPSIPPRLRASTGSPVR